MCGVVGVFDLRPGDDLAALRRSAVSASSRQRHRGPDWSGVYADAGAVLAHERLAVHNPLRARTARSRSA
jgi:asparagine synthase (glutamine-hydrolysing)